MFELVIELILEAAGEVILQLLVEIAVECGFESVAHSLRGRQTANPFLAAIGLVILGALAGALTSWIYPRRVMPELGFSGISLLAAPLAAGIFMQAFGNWRTARGGDPTLLATFWGGTLFAFAMAAVRWMLVGRTS
jgi:hypothetical protein